MPSTRSLASLVVSALSPCAAADSVASTARVYTQCQHCLLAPAAGVGLALLAVTSVSCVRRWWYELFLVGHTIGWVCGLLFAFIHVQHSDTKALPLFATGLVLLAIDVVVLVADAFVTRPARVVDVGLALADGTVISCSSMVPAYPSTGDGPAGIAGATAAKPLAADAVLRLLQAPTSQPPNAAFLVIDKPNFRYAPGSYVHCALPGATRSWFPHPVSISSSPDNTPADAGGDPGRFTITIKSQGAGTWSGAVASAVSQVLVARATQMAAARQPLAATHATGTTLPGATATRRMYNHVWPLPLGGSTLPPATTGLTSVVDSAPGAVGDSVLPIPADSRHLLSAWISGPFGKCSVQLDRYHHFVLIAGGVGITPVASLHHALVNGRPVESGDVHAPSVRTLTTVWVTRDAGLVTCFRPLLATQPSVPSAAVDGALVHATVFGGGAVKSPLHVGTQAGATAAAKPGGAVELVDWSAPAGRPAVVVMDGNGSSGNATSGSTAQPVPASLASTSTSVSASPSTAAQALDGAAAPSAPQPDGIVFKAGRPILLDVLREAGSRAVAKDAACTSGSPSATGLVSVAVVVCGPDEMVSAECWRGDLMRWRDPDCRAYRASTDRVYGRARCHSYRSGT